jgi:hypothetical protein
MNSKEHVSWLEAESSLPASSETKTPDISLSFYDELRTWFDDSGNPEVLFLMCTPRLQEKAALNIKDFQLFGKDCGCLLGECILGV